MSGVMAMARPAVLEPKNGAKNAWLNLAAAEIENMAKEARETGVAFSSDQFRERIPLPDHPAWAGTAWSAARNRGIIEPVGWRISTSRSRHGGPVRGWRPTGE